jgi:tripeptide aminopeptidase
MKGIRHSSLYVGLFLVLTLILSVSGVPAAAGQALDEEAAQAFAQAVEERFLRYVQIDTTSDAATATVPSTPGQFDLLRMLETELRAMGAADVTLTENGFLFATLPATVPEAAQEDIPVIAYLAHVDTVPGIGGELVTPRVHRAYDGQPILFPEDDQLVLSPESSPYLAQKIGHDIVTASGGSVLGADDKSGVAIIMTMAGHLLGHPEIVHGEIRLVFTPDEEIGTGIGNIDLSLLNAGYAYTLDGGEVGEVVYETFSADQANVKITGVSTHPGHAKGKMVNALLYAAKFAVMLPQSTRTPETTDGREGFIHLTNIEGTAAEATLHYILRDFELDGLAAHGELLLSVCDAVQRSDPRLKVECTITPQYRNMRYWLEEDMRPVNLAVQAMHGLGIEPICPPVRGGTDGSQLTAMGVSTPNLFTGMQEYHSPLEWVSVQDMAQAAQLLVRLSEIWAVPMAGETASGMTYDDPFTYCAAVDTRDVPDEQYTGPAMPETVVEGLRTAVQTPDAPAEFFAEGRAFWRCMDGQVFGCVTGANIPCMEKADASQEPSAALAEFCQQNPGAAVIPAAVTGRATVYAWRCDNNTPTAGEGVAEIDAQGFNRNFWYELPAP